MSAVSMNVTPRSSVRWIVAIDSSQSAAPYHSLIPMQPRPWAETVKSPSATSRMSVSLLRRTHSAAVDPDLVVEQLQALLPLRDRPQDELAVTSEQVEPLGLTGRRIPFAGFGVDEHRGDRRVWATHRAMSGGKQTRRRACLDCPVTSIP